MPPDSEMHPVTVSKITEVNESVRVVQLDIIDINVGVTLVPGQSLELHSESPGEAAEFTILSTPSVAAATALSTRPYIEVVVENMSTKSAPRMWVDKPPILGTKLMVRVGTSSIRPPASLGITTISGIVFVGGALGVSPLLSILSHLHETGTMPEEVHFLFASRVRGHYNISNVLALERLLEISRVRRGQFHLYLYFSGHPSRTLMESALPRQRFEPRRLLDSDVLGALESVGSKTTTACYIGGPPQLTDHFAELVYGHGLENDHVEAISVTADESEMQVWGDVIPHFGNI